MKASEILKAQREEKLRLKQERTRTTVKITTVDRQMLAIARKKDRDYAHKNRMKTIHHAFTPSETFLEEALQGDMSFMPYEIERGIIRDCPAIFFLDTGEHQPAYDAMYLTVEFVYQLLRFTRDKRQAAYEAQMPEFIADLKCLIDESTEKEISKSTIRKLLDFMKHGRKIAETMSVEVLDRVIGEIVKITTPLTCSGGRFPAAVTRKWLEEIGR